MSHIQISNTLDGYCWHVVKPFIAVLMLYSSGCSSAMGSTLYWVSADVHGPHYGWSMRQVSAMLLVPDTVQATFWANDAYLRLILIFLSCVWKYFCPPNLTDFVMDRMENVKYHVMCVKMNFKGMGWFYVTSWRSIFGRPSNGLRALFH